MMPTVALAISAAAWTLMLAVVGIRHVRLARPAATRHVVSRGGLLLQLFAYVLVSGVLGVPDRPFAQWGIPASAAAAFALCLCTSGAAIVVWSQQTLGTQWSLTARLIEGHRLVTSGPYAVVRHPVYAAMILMVIGTGLGRTTPAGMATALAAYLAGTLVRVRAEERLMGQAFGAAWRAYTARVRALIPGVL